MTELEEIIQDIQTAKQTYTEEYENYRIKIALLKEEYDEFNAFVDKRRLVKLLAEKLLKLPKKELEKLLHIDIEVISKVNDLIFMYSDRYRRMESDLIKHQNSTNT